MGEIILIGAAKVDFLTYTIYPGTPFKIREILAYYSPFFCVEISNKTLV